ncbi:MAG: site-specific integrase [Phycisphaerae bacterium]|nr:site-specific integrase [Phycisphaerae bacterium]
MNAPQLSLSRDSRSIRKKPWLVRWKGEYNPITDKQKRYSKSFAKRKDAEAFMALKSQEFDEGLPRDQVNLTLERFWEKFERSQKGTMRAGSFFSYEETYGRLKTFFGAQTCIRHIRLEHAEEFLAQLHYISPTYKHVKKSLSDSTRNRVLRGCKRLFNKALEWQYIRVNPFDKVKQVKPRTQPWHRMSPEEFESLLNVTETIQKKAFYAIIYGCGLREGEAINLLWDGINIDFDKNKITLINRPGNIDLPPFHLKDHESRSIPMPGYVVNYLLQVQEQAEQDCPFVFLDKARWDRVKAKWRRFQQEGIERKWDSKQLHGRLLAQFKRHCRMAGIKTTEKLTVHSLRKSWACNLADNAVPIHTLMKLGGWSSIETCQQYYLQSTDENEKKAIEGLEKMMRM